MEVTGAPSALFLGLDSDQHMVQLSQVLLGALWGAEWQGWGGWRCSRGASQRLFTAEENNPGVVRD